MGNIILFLLYATLRRHRLWLTVVLLTLLSPEKIHKSTWNLSKYLRTGRKKLFSNKQFVEVDECTTTQMCLFHLVSPSPSSHDSINFRSLGINTYIQSRNDYAYLLYKKRLFVDDLNVSDRKYIVPIDVRRIMSVRFKFDQK